MRRSRLSESARLFIARCGVLQKSARAACETLEGRMLLSAVSWTGMGGDNQWTTPGNWSTGMLPGPADDITIDVAGNPTIVLGSGAQSIHSLDAANSLLINGGSLSLAAGSQVSNLNLSGGELGGGGNLTVTGAFTWLGGTLSLPQTTAQSGIDFHGAGDVFLSGKLTNPAG
jgi:hypothetical protein